MERFWNKVSVGTPDVCWPWTAYRKPDGYGFVRFGGGNMKQAHRVAFLLSGNSLKAGEEVCHSCDNPACCNPGHLFQGSHRDNMKDMAVKGRSPGALFSKSQVSEIVLLLNTGKRETHIAKLFSVGRKTISKINRGETYFHWTGRTAKDAARRWKKTPQAVQLAKRLKSSGLLLREIADQFQVSISVISRWVRQPI